MDLHHAGLVFFNLGDESAVIEAGVRPNVTPLESHEAFLGLHVRIHLGDLACARGLPVDANLAILFPANGLYRIPTGV